MTLTFDSSRRRRHSRADGATSWPRRARAPALRPRGSAQRCAAAAPRVGVRGPWGAPRLGAAVGVLRRGLRGRAGCDPLPPAPGAAGGARWSSDGEIGVRMVKSGSGW